MVGWILDSIPGVGHVKGALHYIAGDEEAGKRSMYEATRSSLAVARSIVPVGAIDGIGSLVEEKPQGVKAGDIAENIQKPIGSVAKTSTLVGKDAKIGGNGFA